MKLRFVLTLLAGVFAATTAPALTLSVSSFLGSIQEHVVRDGPAATARFSVPLLVASDPAGNLYVVDGHCVRKVSPTGDVSTLAGDPVTAGSSNGTGRAARFQAITGLAADAQGNCYVTELDSYAIRKISPGGVVSIYAGSPTESAFIDGPAATARFPRIEALACDADDNLYVGEPNFGIRKIAADGTVSTLAGSSTWHGDPVDGADALAAFGLLQALVAPAGDSIYAADGPVVRRITKSGVVTTLAGQSYQLRDGTGTAAGFGYASAIAGLSDGSLLVVDSGTLLRRVSLNGVVSTLAGEYPDPQLSAPLDGIGASAKFVNATAIATLPNGDVVVAEPAAGVLRKALLSSADPAPIFLTNPSNAVFLGLNAPLTLNVTTASSSAVTYSWYRDDQPIPGASSTSFNLPNVSGNDAGIYSVEARNSSGTTRGRVAEVKIYTPPMTEFTAVHERDGGSTLWGIASGGGKIVAVGGDGTILVSTTGATWTRADSGSTAWLVGVTYGAGQFVAVGDHGTVLTSTDAVKWTAAADVHTTQRLNNVVYGGGLYVAVGESGTIVTSLDGQTWSLRAAGTTTWLRGLVCNPTGGVPYGLGGSYRDPRFVASGEKGITFGSYDGTNWFQIWTTYTDIEALATGGTYESDAAIGADGTIVWVESYGPGSQWWRPGTVGVTARFRGLVRSAGALFAVGDGGAIVAAPAPSGPWAQLEPGSSAGFTSGAVVGNTLFIVGENETILSSTSTSSRLVNIATRGRSATAEQTLISGFVVQGPSSKKMLIRAAGPALKHIAPSLSTVAKPQLTLRNAKGELIAVNNGWSIGDTDHTIRDGAAAVGAFPFEQGSSDAALLMTLSPGVYTAQVTPTDGAAGLSLVEVYDTEAAAAGDSRAVNISTRGYVGDGDNLMIAGFVIGGDAPRKLLVRAVGPTLATKAGLSGVLAQPKLTLLDQHGNVLNEAEQWTLQPEADELRDAAIRTGAFALDEDSHDAAMIVTLAPGIYTAQVGSADGGTGVALVEVYDLP